MVYKYPIHSFIHSIGNTSSNPNSTEECTVKPGNEDHPWDQKHVVSLGRWSSFSGHSTRDMKGLSRPSVVFVGQRSLFPSFSVHVLLLVVEIKNTKGVVEFIIDMMNLS